ncbi:palmitoyltransferase ZDHHC23-B [Dunckerocampus dactyliophorus]|uniref:palmitoyltransferase ZDHHC23-B n=1 Tax=Dunckerocampus dactyliophorus TaxID=161453 RepID=UPI0024070E2D|nr:palmitoyltransferase ZDHHC23-B [Dunckerocampus dactyliophorus]
MKAHLKHLKRSTLGHAAPETTTAIVARTCNGSNVLGAPLSVMKKRRQEEEEVLCCCEYVNRHGERSHVAACCCNCEDLDDMCDRFFKREPQNPESMSRVAAVIRDRLRVPWLWGGAQKVDPSIIPPLLILPALLHLAAVHFLLGVGVLTILPVLVLWYYYITHRKKGRTLFFLSLALFSLAYMYYVFIIEVLPQGDISPFQVAVVTAGVVFTLLCLIQTKRGPGIVKSNQELIPDPPFSGRRPDITVADQMGWSQEAELSRKNWCHICRVSRPPRAGHCRICGVCVLRHDHHCVWINSCVGQANHRSFLLTIVVFLLTSLYGINLVLRSVCPAQNVLIALLYCPGVYEHYSAALCFTCAWYCSMVTGGLLHLLLVQIINISYNVTEREARAAFRDRSGRRAFWGLAVDTGVYSRGFRGNWAEFITAASEGTSHFSTQPDVV